MSLNNRFPDLSIPVYPERIQYHLSAIGGVPMMRAWEFNGWPRETMSWKSGCYIHAGLSDTGPLVIKGPDALRFLEHLCINSFRTYPIGSMKHAVMLNDAGIIGAHGILQRKGESEFELWAAPPWPLWQLEAERRQSPGLWDVDISMRRDYLFQVAGPRSLELLERVTGESLRDIRFLRFRNSRINGRTVEVGRIGMSGNLAYELHGPIEEGPEIYDAVYRAGREFNLERLGWGSYLVNHVEGGFPQITWTFISTTGQPEAEDRAFTREHYHISGSVNPEDLRARQRTAVEVGWAGMCRFDHDFVGRSALEAEVKKPRRTVATLRWNAEDVLDIHASLFRTGEPFKQIDLPYAPNVWPQAHADHITRNGKTVGISSGAIYSLYFREVLSMACIDVDLATIGTEVDVQWGDFGGRIKNVRATVERFPYLTEGRNSAVDVGAGTK